MHHHSPITVIKGSILVVLLAISALPLLTGCDLIDQLLDGGSSGGGTTNGIQAVMTAQIDDDMVKRGANPDHRPPIWYKFSAMSSLDQYGDPIHKPRYEVAWDFGDGETRAFEWGNYTIKHIYREEGTYTATLTVREAPEYGNASATAQKTITIGPAWLKIVSLTTEPRADGRFDVTVIVRNQSDQAFQGIQVDLVSAEGTRYSALSATFSSETTPKNSLAPGGVYTLRTSIGPWAGTLRARSSWCGPLVGP